MSVWLPERLAMSGAHYLSEAHRFRDAMKMRRARE
jgi:hypothetical protein